MDFETVKAKDVRIGDKIMMPNSRHPQTVDNARDNTHDGSEGSGTVIELQCGDARLVLDPDADVRKVATV